MNLLLLLWVLVFPLYLGANYAISFPPVVPINITSSSANNITSSSAIYRSTTYVHLEQANSFYTSDRTTVDLKESLLPQTLRLPPSLVTWQNFERHLPSGVSRRDSSYQRKDIKSKNKQADYAVSVLDSWYTISIT